MRPVTVVEGVMCPLYLADVDTDQIMPKQFLKGIGRTGYGQHVFHEWRRRPDFVLNDPRYAGARVLLAGPNFGCGSSREHAPWGLLDYGFDVVVAPSFGDIFRTNCFKNGLLAVQLSVAEVERLVSMTEAAPTIVRVDLPTQTVEATGFSASFDIDQQVKAMLVEGQDEIGLALDALPGITAFEKRRPAWMPVVSGPNGLSNDEEERQTDERTAR